MAQFLYRVAHLVGARFTVSLPTTPQGAKQKGAEMLTTITHPQTVSELADIVEAFYQAHDATPPPRASYDAVARALGVATTCTGNPDTAAESLTHTPKAGLSVSFYSAEPTHRTEGADIPLTAYYVATWKGAKYRGHIVLSSRGYHADEPNGFVCWDRNAYTDSLPDGCRKLVAQLVTDAVKSSGVSLDDMRQEWQQSATYYEISSKLYEAKNATEWAQRVIEKAGR